MIYYEVSRLDSYGVFAEIMEAKMRYPPMCPVCKRVGDRLSPLSISLYDDNPLGDFTWLAPDVFISENCKAVLEKLASQDFRFEKVEILGKRQESIWHLNILSRCTFSPESNVVLLEDCNNCGLKIYSTWDGGIKVNSNCHASLFRLEEHPGMIFVNQDIKNYLITEGLTNIEFTKSDKIEDEFAYLRQRKKLK